MTAREHLVIGLDCSTTAIKAIAFEKSGRVAARTSVPVTLSSPQPDYYEQDPGDWWRSARRALRDLTRRIKPASVAALAISNQRETFVPLGKDFEPLRPAILWLDERCKNEVTAFARKIGESRMHRITGKPVDYAPVVYRLAWMKKHETDLFKKIAMICDVHAYLVWRLTGTFKTSWASADPLGLFDLEKKHWSHTILSGLNLREDELPATFAPGTILGRISLEASKATGLSPNTLVVAGGGDGQAAGLGSNVLTSNRAYLNLGTAVVAGVFGTRYRVSKAFRTMCSCSNKGYYYECSLRAGTFAIDWFIRKILGVEPARHPEVYSDLEEEARGVSRGSDGLLHLPYICGVMNPHWDMNARGAFIGLSSSHHRGHMYRAILEGIAFEQLLALDAVEKHIGARIRRLHTIGGGAANMLWRRILADVTGRSIVILENPDASGLGAAIAAAVAVGWHRNFAVAAAKMSRVKSILRPNLRSHREYQQRFKVYRRIYEDVMQAEGRG